MAPIEETILGFVLATKRVPRCKEELFQDYPQRGTQYKFGFSVVTSLLVVESITGQ